jgi:Tol biopolymer transport system component
LPKHLKKILILLIALLVASGCFRKGKVPPLEETQPVINSISIEPQLEVREELIIVEPNIKINVDASDAERVDFFANEASKEEIGQSIWIDENGGDGWTADYSLPQPNVKFKITIRAYYKDKTAEEVVYILTEEKEDREDLINEQPVELTENGGKIARLQEVKGLPKYFLAQGWVDNSRFFGQTGTTPIFVNSSSFGYKTMRVKSWQSYLSPDGKWLSYLNEQGINIMAIDGSSKRRFQPQENSSLSGQLAGGVWSPGSDKLLFWLQKEANADYLIYDLKTSSIKQVNTDLEGYLDADLVGWIDNNRILFNTRAWIKKDGSGESPSGCRSDLAVANLDNDSYTLITSSQDGVFLKGVQILDENTAVAQINNDGDTPSSYVFVNLSGNNYQLIPVKNATRLAVSQVDKQLAYLTNHGRSRGNRTANLIVEDRTGKIRLAKITYDSIAGPFWSPNGKWLLFSITYNRPVEGGGKGYLNEYKTYLCKLH